MSLITGLCNVPSYRLDMELLASELSDLSGVKWEKPVENSLSYAHLTTGNDFYPILVFYFEQNKVSITGTTAISDFDCPRKTINCSVDKSPEQIAKDINRRLLSPFLPLYQQEIEVYLAGKNKSEKMNLLVNELCDRAAIDAPSSQHSFAARGFKKVREIQVNSLESVKLTLKVSPDEAREIIGMLCIQ